MNLFSESSNSSNILFLHSLFLDLRTIPAWGRGEMVVKRMYGEQKSKGKPAYPV